MTAATSPSPRRGPVVRCPACGRDCRFDASNAWRPFCSERCKGTDLGAWASERYRVAGAPAEPDGMGDNGSDASTQH